MRSEADHIWPANYHQREYPFDEGVKCVYLHIDVFGIFYVGMGYHTRAYGKTSRSKSWHERLILNGGQYKVIIFESGLTSEHAAILEKQLIAVIGLHNLTNKSVGGQYAAEGMRHSEESKRKISLNSASRRPEFRDKLRTKMKGAGNPMFGRTHDMRARQSIAEARSDKTFYTFTNGELRFQMTRTMFRAVTGASIWKSYDVIKRNACYKGWRHAK